MGGIVMEIAEMLREAIEGFSADEEFRVTIIFPPAREDGKEEE